MSELISGFDQKFVPQDICERYHVISAPDVIALRLPEPLGHRALLETPSRPFTDAEIVDQQVSLLLYPGRHPSRFHDTGFLRDKGIGVASFENDTPWNRTVAEYLLKAIGSVLNGGLKRFKDPTERSKIELEEIQDSIKVGIIGVGSIGSRFAKLSKRSLPNSQIHYWGRNKNQEMEDIGGKRSSLEELLGVADYVIATLPITIGTRHILGYPQFMGMRVNSVFVNISAGGVVDDSGLVSAMGERSDITAIVDTSEEETRGWMDSIYMTDTHALRYKADGRLITTGHTAYKSPTSTYELVRTITRPLLGDKLDELPGRMIVPPQSDLDYNEPYILKID